MVYFKCKEFAPLRGVKSSLLELIPYETDGKSKRYSFQKGTHSHKVWEGICLDLGNDKTDSKIHQRYFVVKYM